MIELVPGAPIVRPFTSRRFFADAKGIVLTSRTGCKALSWLDVRRCVFLRPSFQHDSFVELRLELPAEIFVLTVDAQNDIKQWAGPKPEVVSEFIKRHIQSDRVVDASLDGPARSIAEVDARIERLRQLYDELTKYVRWMYVLLPACLGLWVWYSWPKNSADTFGIAVYLIGVVVVATGYGTMFFGYSYFGRRRFNEQITDLRTQRDSLVEKENKEVARTRATIE